jgi:DnaJ-class molecular chaperone
LARKKKPVAEPRRIPTEIADCPSCDGTGVRPIDEAGDDQTCGRCRGKGHVLRVVGQSGNVDDDEEDC